MSRALELARSAAECQEVPVGCVIVNNGQIIAESFNSRERDCNPTAHAELLCILQAAKALKRWRLFDCTLYVTLEPCYMCAGAIVNARMERVVFAAHDPKGGAAGSLANVLQDARLNHRCQVTSGLFAQEAGSLLKDFFKKRRKIADNFLR